MALEGSGSVGKHGDSQVSAPSHSTQPPVHRGGGGGGGGGVGGAAGGTERCLIYISSFSSPSNDFGVLLGLDVASCIKDNNLKISEVPDTLPPVAEISSAPHSQRQFAAPNSTLSSKTLYSLVHGDSLRLTSSAAAFKLSNGLFV